MKQGPRRREGRRYRLHQGGLRVGYQHEHVSVQAELVDPAVQLCGDIDSRARGDRGKPTGLGTDFEPCRASCEQTGGFEAGRLGGGSGLALVWRA